MATDAHGWTNPAFLEQAHSWIETQLAVVGRLVSGPIAQPHVQPWSTVLRIPTDSGPVFFKANHAALRHEAAITAYLGERRPDVVPPPLAVDAERGWMLMADAGTRLREIVAKDRSLAGWMAVLPLYAGLQLDLAGASDDLIALGAPDLRLATLSSRYEGLLGELEGVEEVPEPLLRRARAAVAHVAALCAELGAYQIPETIQHDDLNDGQVYGRDGRYVVLDWGDACVSHPFFTMSVTLEGVISWGVDDIEDSVDTAPFRDAYLAPFADALGSSMADLQAACVIATRLGWACRAANGHLSDDPESTVRRLQMFLDGRV